MGAGVALVVGVKVVVMVENREAAEAVPAEAAVAEAVEGTEQGTARFEVGVGPWEGPWPEGDYWDEELLREGDRRNVVDKYRYWSMDAIIADLDTRRHDFHVAIENWQHDLNIGTVVRTANAMLAKEVHIIGRRRWNRRGAMVTDRYQHVRHHPTIEDFVAWAQAEGRRVVAVEDTSTTGGSALTAVEALRKAGAEVVAVAVIVDRATGAKEHVEEVAGVPCLYAYSKDELGLD